MSYAEKKASPSEKGTAIPLIIPAYEPDERMITLLRRLAAEYEDEIVVVNDGSGPAYDSLYAQAVELGCTVLTHYVNMGKGRALKDAFNYCLCTWPDMRGCITADSDGQHIPEDIHRCREIMLSHGSDLILGCRDFDGAGIPWKSTFGNKLTRQVCRLLSGLKITDTQTGLRGIPRDFMAKLVNTPGERFEFEMQMLLDTKGCCSIREFSIQTIYDSEDNHSTHFDPVKDSIRVYSVFGRQFLLFVFSSLSSAVLDLVLFSVFVSLLKGTGGIWYAGAAAILARILSASYNFLINHRLVFKSQVSKRSAALRYFALAVVQMLASALLVTGGVYLLPMVPELAVKIVVDTVLFFISYTIQREMVFSA